MLRRTNMYVCVFACLFVYVFSCVRAFIRNLSGHKPFFFLLEEYWSRGNACLNY